MPGILGVVIPGPDTKGAISTHTFQPGSTPLESYLDRMIGSMHRRSWFQVQKRIQPAGWRPSCGLASLSLGGRTTLVERDGFLLAYSGEIFLNEQQVGSAFAEGDERLGERLLSMALHADRNEPGRALCGLNGLYVIAIWDARRQSLTIVNDRYGLQRLYYRRIANGGQTGFMFASEIKALSQDPSFQRKLNELAIADYLVAGHLLDDRTFFEDIYALPAASLLTFRYKRSGGQLSIRQYWEPSFSSQQSRRSENDYIEGLAHYIQQAVGRRACLWAGRSGGKTSLLLTGGLDSRIIAGTLIRLRLAPAGLPAPGPAGLLAHTIGLAGSSDVRLAQEIARIAGLPHHTIPIAPNYIARYAEECMARAEGHMNCHAAWIFAQDPFLREQEIRFAMTGLFGEVISGRNWSPRIAADLSPVEALLWYQRRIPGGLESSLALLRPDIAAQVKGESLHSIQRTLAYSGSRNPLDQFDYYHLRQKIRRQAGSSDVLEDFCRVVDPFIDNDLVDFALQIPASLRLRGSLYKKMITRCFPEVAAIGLGGSDRPLRQIVARENALARKLVTRGRWIYRQVNRKARSRQSTTVDIPGSAILYHEWMRTASREFILNVLDESLPAVFDRPAVSRLVDQYMNGDPRQVPPHAFQSVGALVTISLWSQYFTRSDFGWHKAASIQRLGSGIQPRGESDAA